MACVDHTCHECGKMWEDNYFGGPCPKCGSDIVSSHHDEYEPEPEEEDEHTFRSRIYGGIKQRTAQNARDYR